MRIFSDSPEQAAKAASNLTDKWMPEVMKKEAELLARNDVAMEEMRAEMKRQRDGWAFRCHRFGDFLSLEIERRANPAPEPWPKPWPHIAPGGWYEDSRRYAATINLNKVTQIVLTAGAEPDFSGRASYYVNKLRRADNFCDFAGALMKSARGVVYLVIEEAHEFAPKERAGIGNENLSIHWAKKLATAGRSKGIRLIFASQRTQSLHNACLSSCETLIAHRLTTPDAQAPVVRWLKGNAGKTAAEEVERELSSLPNGSAWVSSGEAQILRRVAFPRNATYDNTATPLSDGDEETVARAAVDITALEKLIGKAAEEAKANDPKALKAEITKLKKELAAKPATPATGLEGKTLGDLARIEDAAEQRGYVRGCSETKIAEMDALRRIKASALGAMRCRIYELNEVMEGHCAAIDHEMEKLQADPAPLAPPPQIKRRSPTKPAPNIPASASDLTPALQKVIDAIAWWHAAGFEKVKRAHASVVAGYSPRASTFHGYVAKLAAMGLVDTADGAVALTPEGLALANQVAAATDEDLANMVRSLLKPQQVRVFEAVRNVWPDSITRADIAEAVGLSARASTVHGYIAAVAAYGVIETGAGTVKAADWLFPEAR